MTAASCTTPVAPATRIAYWLGELDPDTEAQVDEHLLGCDECARQVQALVALAGGIRRIAGRGTAGAVVSPDFVRRLAAAGVRLREYRVAPSGSVHCTVAPDDDVVIAFLEAPLAGVGRVDLIQYDIAGGAARRLEDVPFDAAATAVVIAPDISLLRAMPAATQRLRLVAVEDGGDRVIGDYAFQHAPWGGAAHA